MFPNLIPLPFKVPLEAIEFEGSDLEWALRFPHLNVCMRTHRFPQFVAEEEETLP